MESSQSLIHYILGPCVHSRPLVTAVDILMSYLSAPDFDLQSIAMHRDIYPKVAVQLSINPISISKTVDRLAKCCWGAMISEGLCNEIIGRTPSKSPKTLEMVFYLAYFSFYRKPYFEQSIFKSKA